MSNGNSTSTGGPQEGDLVERQWNPMSLRDWGRAFYYTTLGRALGDYPEPEYVPYERSFEDKARDRISGWFSDIDAWAAEAGPDLNITAERAGERLNEGAEAWRGIASGVGDLFRRGAGSAAGIINNLGNIRIGPTDMRGPDLRGYHPTPFQSDVPNVPREEPAAKPDLMELNKMLKANYSKPAPRTRRTPRRMRPARRKTTSRRSSKKR